MKIISNGEKLMTIKIEDVGLSDRILELIGKKRLVKMPKGDMSKYGIYLARRENFLHCLLRSKDSTVLDGWFYPDELKNEKT